MHTKWEELGIANDFMFGKVMQEPGMCRRLLEIILDKEIDHIEYPEEQKTLDITKDARSVRLDVYVADGKGTVYDIEMQTTDTRELPKRSRYYQGMIDLNLIEKGESYKRLNPSFVIFICTFDLFGKGRHCYTFENRCAEEPELRLGDESCKIFLNSAGTLEDVSGDLKAFLSYVGGKKTENTFVQLLDKEVERVKRNEEWRREYMTLQMRDQENLEKGMEIGLQKGRAEGREEGREEGSAELILNMRRNNISLKKIAELTGKSEEWITDLLHRYAESGNKRE